MMSMIEAMIAVMIGIGAGAWGYRYILRRDPAALERMAAQIRAAGRNLGSDR